MYMHALLGEKVSGVASIALTHPKAQKRVGTALWRAHIHSEWTHGRGGKAEQRRIACGGNEANWVVAIPSRPTFRLSNNEWRNAIAFRLGGRLPSLGGPSTACDCHESFARGTTEIEHDPSCFPKAARWTSAPPGPLVIKPARAVTSAPICR